MSATRYPIGTEDEEAAAIAAAAMAVHRGELVVIPTDTVYGIAADAFDPESVQLLLDAKGRDRQMPPPVLVSAVTTLDALATEIPDYVRTLVAEFWPGPLTVVCRQQPSLQWDLGETRGTVAIRMPRNDLALALLERTGPLAVSSANLTGQPAARSADDAERMLGDAVAVIVDGGPSGESEASTIVDASGERPALLRLGAISVSELNEVLSAHDLAIPDPASAATGPERPDSASREPAD
jgi:L-threonylcarbamoyladenylate synthase